MTVSACPAGQSFAASVYIPGTLLGSTEDDGVCTSCVPGRYKATDLAAVYGLLLGTFSGIMAQQLYRLQLWQIPGCTSRF